MTATAITDAHGTELLLLKIRELDQVNLRLEERLQRLLKLEAAVRKCAEVDMAARELLTAMEG